MTTIDHSQKTHSGNFFEDFSIGQVIDHATPKTITIGDTSLYSALYGSRFILQSSEPFAKNLGYRQMPVDDLLVFHIVFGKTVPDISLNAVANLGYGEGIFGVPVYAGDTVHAQSEVIGVKQNSNGKTGVVYVRTTGRNQHGDDVLSYVRWVMVNKSDANSPAPKTVIPKLINAIPADALAVPSGIDLSKYDMAVAGSAHYWDDYQIGETIDHVDGMTIEEAEHMTATRLYQNTARVHFNQHLADNNRFSRRLIYGGHIISLARALSFNGLGNAFHIAAINGGQHINPTFAGDTLYASSQIIDKNDISGRSDIGAVRLTMTAAKNKPINPLSTDDPACVLEFDIWVLLPKK